MFYHVTWRSNDGAIAKNICPKTFAPDCIWVLQGEMELWLGHNIGYSTIWRALHRLGYTNKQVFRIFFDYIF